MFIAHPDFLRTHSKYILMYRNPSHSHCCHEMVELNEETSQNDLDPHGANCIPLPHVQKALKHHKARGSHCSQSSLKILLFENRPDSTSGLWARTMRGNCIESTWTRCEDQDGFSGIIPSRMKKKRLCPLKKRYPKYLWLRIIDINWGITLSPILEQTLLPSFPIFTYWNPNCFAL